MLNTCNEKSTFTTSQPVWKILVTVKPVLSDHPSIYVTWKSLLTGGCLLLNEKSAESLSALHSCSNISNHLSEKSKLCLDLYGGLTQI